MSAAVWCKEHIPTRTVVHRLHDPANQTEGDKDLNALQLYVQHFKQADLTLTGTVRKANLVTLSVKNLAAVVPTTNVNRRQSTTTIPNGTSQRASSAENNANSGSLPQSGDKICITCGIDVSPKWWPIDKDQEKIIANGNYGSLGSEAQKFIAQRAFQCHKCKKDGRQPTPHVTPSLAEPLPPVEQRPPPPPIAATSLASPPHVSQAPTNQVPDFRSTWGPRAPIIQAPPAPPAQTVPPPVVAAPSHVSSAGPPPPLALNPPSHAGPSPMAAPGHPSVASQYYPPPHSPYNDWHRGATQSSGPISQLNGGPVGPSHTHHSALRGLRPPPIGSINQHQVTPPQHGLGQPILNGVPASPPRRGAPSIQNGASSYMPPYRHPTHHGLPSLTNGVAAPRASEHSFSQGLLHHHRSPFSTPHGSPPVSRDELGMGREQSILNNPPARTNESQQQPANGASTSPAVHNLLL